MVAPAYDGQQPFRPLRVVDESPRFAQLWESVLFDPELSSNAKVIYAVLQRMAYEAHGADLAPSMKRIADRANIKDRETVATCLRALEERGHIRRVARTKWEADIIVLTTPSPRRAEETRNDAEETRTGHADISRTGHADISRNLIETNVETDVETFPPVVPQGTREGDEDEEEPENDGYTPEYEAFWRDYAKRPNNSKARGFVAWKKLTAKQQRAAHRALPAHLQCHEWRVQRRIPHTATYLNGKLWENMPIAAEQAPPTQPADRAMQMWLRLCRAKDGSQPWKRDDEGKWRVPGDILDAASGLGGIDAIDPANEWQRRDFLRAVRALEVAS